MVECGVAYNSNLEEVKELTMQAIAGIFPQQQQQEEVEFMYKEFGDNSFNYVVRFWTNATINRDILLARSKAIIEIKRVYDQKKNNIPFPIRTIDFSNKLDIQTEPEA